MGWTFSSKRQTLAQFQNERILDMRSSSWIVRDIEFTPGAIWYALEWPATPDRPMSRLIAVDLIEGNAGGGWGYKPLDETMGPCNHQCPLRMLDYVPDPGCFATEWRGRVRAWHEMRALVAA